MWGGGLSTGVAAGLAARRAELRLAVRITVAGVAALAVGNAIDLPQTFWAVITALLVVQANVGGSLKAALDRLIGTVGGAAFGGLVAWSLPHEDWRLIPVAALTIAPLAYLAATRPSFRIAPVTAVIVLIGAFGQASPIVAAADRVIEIVIGSLVGLATSILVLPARAHGQVGERAGRILTLLAELVEIELASIDKPADVTRLASANDRMREALNGLDTAAAEARRETTTYLARAGDPDAVVRTLRRLRYNVLMIGRTTGEAFPATAAGVLSAPLSSLRDALAAHLRALGRTVAERRSAPDTTALTAAFEGFSAAMAELREQRLTRGETMEEAARVFTLAFTLEQTRRNLSDLIERLGEFAGSGGDRNRTASTGLP